MLNIIVWGTGEIGRAIKNIIDESMSDKYKIVAFVDNIKKRANFLGVRVIRQEDLHTDTTVLVGVDKGASFDSIVAFLTKRGIRYITASSIISEKTLRWRRIINRGNVDADNYGKFAPLETPMEIYIDTCSKCNLYCTFCPTNMVREGREQRNKVMEFRVFEKIVEDLKKFKEKINIVRLQQFGEPLLNPRLPDMVHLLKEANVCNTIHLVTNGVLLHPQLSQALIDSGLDVLRVSVNGLSTEDYKKSAV